MILAGARMNPGMADGTRSYPPTVAQIVFVGILTLLRAAHKRISTIRSRSSGKTENPKPTIAAIDTTREAAKSPLLLLPAELRDLIYAFALTEDESIEISCDGELSIPALLQVCRQTREEADKIFYRNNSFHMVVTDNTYERTSSLMNLRSTSQCNSMNRLVLRYKTISYCELTTTVGSVVYLALVENKFISGWRVQRAQIFAGAIWQRIICRLLARGVRFSHIGIMAYRAEWESPGLAWETCIQEVASGLFKFGDRRLFDASTKPHFFRPAS